MQCEFSNEWDYIQNSISDLTNKLELLPDDLKDKAVKLLQEKLSVDDSTLPTNPSKKMKRVSGRNIKKTKRNNDYITEESDENIFTYDTLRFNNGDLDIKLEISEHEEMEEVPIICSQTPELSEFICEICAFVGSNANEMKKHKRLAHGIIQERICHSCGKVLPNFRQLQAHMAGHLQELELDNVHQEAQKFECEICGTKLRSKWTYMEHIGRHFNRQRKTCDICGKLFPNSSQLNAHKRVHEPPKMPCFVCNKKFRNKHKLAIHFLIHSGQRDFACPECPYKTYLKHNLQKHCLRQHNINYPPVRQAIKRFHPDEFETSMLNDPVARSHITNIRIKGECFPMNVTSEINKKGSEEISSEYDVSDLIISNEVEINDDGKILAKQRKKRLYAIPKVEKVKKEKLVKLKKDKSIKIIKEKTPISIKEENIKHSPSNEKFSNDNVILGFNSWSTTDDGATQIFHFNPDTSIDCVEETIYA